MRKRSLIIIVLLFVASIPVSAQGMFESSVAQSFGASITFRLEVRLDNPLADCTLFFGRSGVPLVRRVYPDFEPRRNQTLEFVEQLEAGQYAPGTDLIYWWELTDTAGNVQVTPVSHFVYVDDTQDWQILRGDGINLYWYRDQDRAREVLQAAESALALLEEEIGVSPDGAVSVYCYDSARDMEPALSVRAAGYDEFIITLGVAVDDHTVLLLGSHRNATLTVAHELSHIIVGQTMSSAFANMPRWFDEGLAMYAEGELPVGNQNALNAAIENDSLLSLRSMTTYSGDPSVVDLYYGEARSVVAYILENYGQAAIREILAEFNTGVSQDEALKAVLDMDLGELETAWRASLGLGPRSRPVVEAALIGARWVDA